MSHGFHDVLVKGFVDEVVILCGGKESARHPRCYALGAFVADPLHLLALVETKPNASRSVRPWAEVRCRLSVVWLTVSAATRPVMCWA